MYYLAKSIKDLIKVDEDFPLCDLGNVVHALASIVSDTGILVGEAREHGRDDLFKIASYILQQHEQ